MPQAVQVSDETSSQVPLTIDDSCGRNAGETVSGVDL